MLSETEEDVEHSVDMLVGESNGRIERVAEAGKVVDRASRHFEESTEEEKSPLISVLCQATLASR